jgi:serine/threonine protein kinase
VLHNDVKPANLLVDAAGRVWVTDFGLAQEVDPESDLADDRVTGTLRYMAPERFHGICNEASDIYSLGVTLFELLTRVPAFSADDRTSLVEQISKGQLQRPRDVNREIPAGLDAIVRKATERDSARRYQSSAQLVDDLQRFVSGKSVQARREQGLFGWLRRGR